mmetsp:Transcript_106457/g.147433  ORF Transcript_106457/g.147433 Transcript_106457/m.147433 type:complete len:103 (+) Transcript_106457:346-654(+)
MFMIEIFLSNKDDLVISAQSVYQNESFIIEINAEMVDQLLNEFQGNYNQMAAHLKLMNKRMVLLNPKFSKKQEGDQQQDSMQEEQQENNDQEDHLSQNQQQK